MPQQSTDAPTVTDCGRQQAELESRPDRHAKALAGAPTDKLLQRLNDLITRRDLFTNGTTVGRGERPPERSAASVEATLLLGAELCRRNIAPVWRSVRWYCGPRDDPLPWWHDPSADLMMLMLDAQWVGHRWPKHRPAWQRAEGLTDPKTLKAAAAFLHHDGRRPPGQLAVALALTPDQQIELCHARSIGVSKRVCWMWRHQADAREQIATQVRAEDQRSEAEHDATIDRRHKVWQAGHLTDGRPTRTAELLTLRPDARTLNRGTVARDWSRVCNLCQSDTRKKPVKWG